MAIAFFRMSLSSSASLSFFLSSSISLVPSVSLGFPFPGKPLSPYSFDSLRQRPSTERGMSSSRHTSTILPVSYTHLRAHETDSYLVCRLLLEKKKRNTLLQN